MNPIILLTGRPGVGKTTAIKALIALLGNRTGGFYTRALRGQGRRTGFEIVTLDGRTAWLASRSTAPIFKEEARLGRYRINLVAVDSIAIPALRRALAAEKIVIIDEIGPMEIASALFRRTVLEILAGEAAVVGSIAQRPHAFTDQVKAHPRVQIKVVTPENRDQIPITVAAALLENRDQSH